MSSDQQSTAGDLKKLVDELIKEKAMSLTVGRQYKCYTNMKPSLPHGFNPGKLYKWINKHKKKIILNRNAR